MSSKYQVVVLKIVAGQLTVSAAAEEYGMSRRHLHRLFARYREEGLDGLEARSRAPLSSPHAATDRVRDRIVQLRGRTDRGGNRCRAGHDRVLTDDTTVTVVHTDTGEIIATNTIDPTRAYWRNTQKEPGRWPGSSR